VLCSAVLAPAPVTDHYVSVLNKTILKSEFREELLFAFEPLIRNEERVVNEAASGNSNELCCLLEHGSLIAFARSDDRPHSCSQFDSMDATLDKLESIGLTSGRDAILSRYYGGVYFSYRQAVELDNILFQVNQLEEPIKDTFLAATLSTTSDVVNTVGKQFAQPIRPRDRSGSPKSNLYQLVSRDRNRKVLDVFREWSFRYIALTAPKFDNTIVRGDYREILSGDTIGSARAIYADPPYTRDHYSRYYHILETICAVKIPDVTRVATKGISRVSRGIYPTDRHQSPFSIKTQAPGAFESLFEGVRGLSVPLIVSYSPYAQGTRARPRLMTISEITKMAGDFFRAVEIRSAGTIAHNKFNSAQHNTERRFDAEVLIVCLP